MWKITHFAIGCRVTKKRFRNNKQKFATIKIALWKRSFCCCWSAYVLAMAYTTHVQRKCDTLSMSKVIVDNKRQRQCLRIGNDSHMARIMVLTFWHIFSSSLLMWIALFFARFPLIFTSWKTLFCVYSLEAQEYCKLSYSFDQIDSPGRVLNQAFYRITLS